jgi:hypothetical protein
VESKYRPKASDRIEGAEDHGSRRQSLRNC